VTSKYDRYWASRRDEIRKVLDRAAEGFPATVALQGLRDFGDRQSWYGLAEVRADQVTRSSMAHATSLGRVVAASGICTPWPGDTFRLVVNADGDALTITADRQDSLTEQTARRGLEHRQPSAPAQDFSSASEARAVPPLPATVGVAVGPTAPGELYLLLAELAGLVGGMRRLRDCRAGDLPRGGVYFFFEDGEVCGDGSSRVVRVGTHGLTATSQATLWSRLRHHRGHLAGRDPGSGNHRASVFRRHVGAALVQRDSSPPGLLDSWLDRHGPHPDWASQETTVEMAVSRHIGAMPVLWLSVPDPGTRKYVEQNSIALTSQLAAGQDPDSPGWLGHHAIPREIRQSGLWNVEHVTSPCHPGFLATLEQLIQRHQ
jgi:hypothetical protein